MSAFIQTADGKLINADRITELRIEDGAIFADQHRIGAVAQGGSLERLRRNFAVRLTSMDGILGIEDGAIYRQSNNPQENIHRNHSFGAYENRVPVPAKV